MSGWSKIRSRLHRAALAALAGLLLVPGVVSAHPLGNFTINHYSGLRVAPDRVLVDHIVDYAEIPTFQERQAMDRAGDGGGSVSDAEAAAYRDTACARQAGALQLMVDGNPVVLAAGAAAIQFPQGQAGAATLRLVCVLSGVLAQPIGGLTKVTFSDASYAGRLGWREITVQGDRTTIGAGPLTESRSARLTVYPADLLAQPLDQRSVSFDVAPGGPALPPFSAPELAAGVTSPGVTPPASGTAGGCTDVTAGLPGGTADFGREICELVQARDLTPGAIIVSLFAAALIGAAHAVSPGHGKTVMAAYLVGARGGLRHAIGLGLTVTVSHTIGVLALGGLTIYASTLLPPDRLQLFLGVASGLILIALGLYLIVSRLRTTRRERSVASTGSPESAALRGWPASPASKRVVPGGASPSLATAGAGNGTVTIAGPQEHAHPQAQDRQAEPDRAAGHLGARRHGTDSAQEQTPEADQVHHQPEGHDHPHDHPHEDADGHDHQHADAHGHDHQHADADGHDHPHADADGHDHPHADADGHDHPHADADGHDHPHVDADAAGWHSHGLFRHTHIPAKLPDGLSWRALFALGLSGGLVPSASAVIVLLVSISLGRPAYGIVLTIAFGLGMAVVLIGIGIALVYARGLIERMPRRSRLGALMRFVPMATAVFVLVVGVAVTAQALGQVR
jgi:ABC-type nickel/cobalt efflux system permease component RcnA